MSSETDTPGGAVSAEQAAAAEPSTAEWKPTETVGHGEQTASRPPGTAAPAGGVPTTEKPEVLVGAAFAGGLVAALVLRKITS